MGQNFILAQAGLFVAADYLKLYPIDGVYTHFNREEDSSMQSGRLDEELKRMDFIVSNIKKLIHLFYLTNHFLQLMKLKALKLLMI
ncbi:MAG: hypothetical protein L6U99_01735 [Clostridium sp.]|nr:MAG: hypothetical protein L6U99_01735 [Clostridium sp.]